MEVHKKNANNEPKFIFTFIFIQNNDEKRMMKKHCKGTVTDYNLGLQRYSFSIVDLADRGVAISPTGRNTMH